MLYKDFEKTIVALFTWREASGEGRDGMKAVMCVARNRVLAGHHTWGEIILAHNQFSSMTVKGDGQTVAYPTASDKAFIDSMALVDEIYGTDGSNGPSSDITGGALYYANLKTATSGWFFDNIVNKPDIHPVTLELGHHTFFK